MWFEGAGGFSADDTRQHYAISIGGRHKAPANIAGGLCRPPA
jgi:hypothetical protein